MRGRELYRQPIESTFQRFRPAEKIAELPEYVHAMSGGLSLDSDGKTLHAGAVFNPDTEWGIVSINSRANTWSVRCRTDFQVGHVQAHPRIPGLVMFCHETGGDAPQRMWRVMPGAATPLPAYQEQGEEWVTHEVWWNNRALFTIWPYDDERLKYRYGIVSVDMQGGDAQWHAKYKAWHTHGSPDGRWILGDDFDRNLWLIAPFGQERRLLSQGHNGEGFTTHPHASFAPDSRAAVSQSSRLGREAVVLIEVPPWEELPMAGTDA
jgi:oligogalacturonide lyase